VNKKHEVYSMLPTGPGQAHSSAPSGKCVKGMRTACYLLLADQQPEPIPSRLLGIIIKLSISRCFYRVISFDSFLQELVYIETKISALSGQIA
jgi:hypothetical protein